jgi:hypothetical protein
LFFEKLEKVTGKKIKKPDPYTPQIRLVTGNDLKKLLLNELSIISTPKKRADLDNVPGLKKVLVHQMHFLLATADWVEQVHKIKIPIDPAIIKWVFSKTD